MVLTTRIDTAALCESLDLRELVRADLGEPKASGHALKYKCPFHNEKHGLSFVVWEHGWRCFGACQAGGDAIAYIQRRDGIGFLEAVALLSSDRPPTRRAPCNPAVRRVPVSSPPPCDWQDEARDVVETAHDHLMGKHGSRALAWLHCRGLGNETIRAARLGYLPGGPRQWLSYKNFQMPCGITIPWFVDDELWAVKVRRSSGEPKYTQPGGGKQSHCLYWAAHPYQDAAIVPGFPVLFTEGEFDTLIAWQEASDLVAPVTLGSATNGVAARWLPLLKLAGPIVLALDNDGAGAGGAASLLKTFPSARVAHVPEGKDITDFFRAQGCHALRAWIKEQL